MGWFNEWRVRRREARTQRLQQRAQHQLAQAIEQAPAETLRQVAAAAGIIGGQFSITSLSQLGYPLVIPPDGYLTPITGGLGVVFRDPESDLDRLLQASAWSWAAITGNAKAISMLVPQVEETVGGTWEKAPLEHPLWGWLDDPLGTDATLPYWPYSHLSMVTTMHQYVVGNGFWVPTIVRGDLRAVYPILNPQSVTATESTQLPGVPIEYRWSSTAGYRTFAPDELINLMVPSGGSFWRGSSALRVALGAVDIDAVAVARQAANLNNHLGANLILNNMQPLPPNKEQRKAFKDELIEDHREVAKQGDPLVIGGMQVTANPVSSPELQVFETKRFARTEILGVIGMPPAVAGILDKMILNNFKVAVVTWWHTHLLPMVQQQLGSINAQLVRPLYGNSTRISYSLAGTDVSLQLLSAKLDVAVQLMQLGYSTNDINEMLALGMPTRDYLNIPQQGALIAGRLDDVIRTLTELQDGILAPEQTIAEDEPAPAPDAETEPAEEAEAAEAAA